MNAIQISLFWMILNSLTWKYWSASFCFDTCEKNIFIEEQWNSITSLNRLRLNAIFASLNAFRCIWNSGPSPCRGHSSSLPVLTRSISALPVKDKHTQSSILAEEHAREEKEANEIKNIHTKKATQMKKREKEWSLFVRFRTKCEFD